MLVSIMLYDTLLALADSEHLQGPVTCAEKIEVIEWFNGEMKGHCIDIH